MAFQVLPPIAFRASLSHKRLDAIESLTVDDGGVMTVHLIHRNLPAVQLLPLRGNVMLFLHDLAACVLFGFQNQLYAGEGEVFCVMDAFHAPFVQFSGNGDVGFPGKVLSENEAHNLRLFRYDQALVAFPAIAEHFLMGMDFTMFKLFLNTHLMFLDRLTLSSSAKLARMESMTSPSAVKVLILSRSKRTSTPNSFK